MKRYLITVELLSPVHIGTNEQVEPLEYVIRDDTFYKVSQEAMIAGLLPEKRNAFDDIIELNDLNKLRTFIAENTDTDKALYRAGVTGKVERLYREKIGDIENQLLVQPHLRTGYSYRPILPGSSIKGAIRTAIVSGIAQEKRPAKPKSFFDELNFEKRVLGEINPNTDPFRVVKIADIELPESAATIGEVSNVRRNKDGTISAVSIQMIIEALWPASDSGPIKAQGEILIDDGLWKYRNSVVGRIGIEDVLKRCNHFYRDKFTKDMEFFAGSPVARIMRQMEEAITGQNSCLIRVGRYSGKLSVTIDNYRKPPDPVTRNIFDDMYPMGWILLRVEKG